jgi:3'(2'), 5'-bisphosphate nucleotidase
MIVLPNPALGPMVNAVAAACRICRTVQSHLVAAGRLSKGDKSPVTIADYASQAVVAEVLARTFPGIALVAEEDSSLLRLPENGKIRAAVVRIVAAEWEGADEAAVLASIDHGRGEPSPSDLFFALDPIDGTKGFLRGEQYAVALALLEDGKPVAGVLGCPNLPGPDAGHGSLFLAVRGRGAYTLPLGGHPAGIAPVVVSDVMDPRDIRFCESVEGAHSHKDRSKLIAEALSVSAPPVSVDSQCKYGLVARGDAELYLRVPRGTDYREKIWDHAAGVLILEEAGGKVTDLDGHPLDFSRGRELTVNRGIVASNGRVHPAVLDAIHRTE